MVGTFRERTDPESPEEIEENRHSHLFRELHGRDIHTLRERPPEGDFPFIVLGIVLWLVGVILAGAVGSREVEDGALRSYPEFLECE